MKRNDVNSKKTIQEVLELFALNEKFKVIEKKYNEKKKALTTSIKNYMFANGDVNTLSFKAEEGKKVVVSKIQQNRIIWNPDKLEERLDKELCNEIIEKVYVISDMQGLVKYLKSCGVNPKTFKSFLNIEKKVKVDVIKQLDELGELNFEDVKGCYQVKPSEGYLKLTLQDEEEE